MNNARVGFSSEIDTNIPNVARVYDYLLGGAHNFTSDRTLATMIERTMPHVRDIVRLNRSFLRRAIDYMIGSGVRQFLDIGSGIPTVGNVHEIAQAIDPECRVVYADKDRVGVIHSQQLLQDNEKAVAIQADIRDPENIIGHATALLDLHRPIGLLNLLVWHFIPDEDDPGGLLACYRDTLASGSYLAITHLTDDGKPPGLEKIVDEVRKRGTDEPTARTHDQIVGMFAGFELLEPGVVGCAEWHPAGPGDFSQDSEANELFYAGVGRKP